MKMCKDYFGVSCIDSSCPVANGEINREEGCQVCWCYGGCSDCLWASECKKEDKEKYTWQEEN